MSNVDPSSAAAAAGLQRGDVIEQVNCQPVGSVSECNARSTKLENSPACSWSTAVLWRLSSWWMDKKGGWNMGRTLLILAVLSIAAARAGNTNPSGDNQDHPKKPKDQITVRGCVSKLNTDYILVQPDRGNSYQLQGSRKLRLGPYLGQQVEVTGRESPSMSTSSDILTRAGSASPVTITVTSIKPISKRCSTD